MNDREVRLKTTVLQMSRVIRALEDLHETVLPRDPRMFAILSQGDMEMIARLCNELGELLGVEFDGRPESLANERAPHAVLEPLSGIDVPPTSIAGKE